METKIYIGTMPEERVKEVIAAVKDQNEISNEEVASWEDDGMKWAQAFHDTAIKLGYSDMDVGWLFSWFANAIEMSHDHRIRQIRKEIDDLLGF